MLLFCVRHGESEANVRRVFPDESNPPALTQKGVEQIKEIANELQKLEVQVVYCSPALRTKLSAQLITQTVNAPLFIDERLKEVDLGRLAGKSHAEVRTLDPYWYEEYFNKENKYGIEKFASIMKRAHSLVEEVHKKGYEKVVFVTHLEIIRALVAVSLNQEAPWIRRIRINTGSITIFEKKENELRLKALNWLPLREYLDYSRS